MKEHVATTGLDVTVNAWSNVFDFTPVDGETEQSNWILLEAEDRLEDFMSEVELLHCWKLDFSTISRFLDRFSTPYSVNNMYSK